MQSRMSSWLCTCFPLFSDNPLLSHASQLSVIFRKKLLRYTTGLPKKVFKISSKFLLKIKKFMCIVGIKIHSLSYCSKLIICDLKSPKNARRRRRTIEMKNDSHDSLMTSLFIAFIAVDRRVHIQQLCQ